MSQLFGTTAFVFPSYKSQTSYNTRSLFSHRTWWRHDMEAFSATLALCEGNPLVIGGFPSQRTSNAGLWCFLWRTFQPKFGFIVQLPIMVTSYGHDGVSNYQPHHCLLNRLFGCRSRKASKLRVTGLCAGNSPGTGEFSALMASNAESVSIWWRHHAVIWDATTLLWPHGYGSMRYHDISSAIWNNVVC